MLTIACVLKSGGIYDASHVERLRDQVAEHMEQPYQFVCLSDIPVPCESEPLVTGYPGWWSKIELFRPDMFDGRVLYLDLDVTITGNLDDLANFDARFAAIKDYQHPIRINSSVMVWDAGIADHIFLEFRESDMERLHGDQNYIHENPGAFTFPKRWCQSYKLQQMKGGFMGDMRVCVFHGQPKPWDEGILIDA